MGKSTRKKKKHFCNEILKFSFKFDSNPDKKTWSCSYKLVCSNDFRSHYIPTKEYSSTGQEELYGKVCRRLPGGKH